MVKLNSSTQKNFLLLLAFVLTGCIFWFSLYAFDGDTLDQKLWLELRLSRSFLAFFVGAALACSGLILQTLFQNPLCEPYTLGLSSGAALGAILAHQLKIQKIWSLTGFAFLGAVFFSFVPLFSTPKELRSRKPEKILLYGASLSLFGGALIALWASLQSPGESTSLLHWLLGSLDRATWPESGWVGFSIFIIIFFIFIKSKSLDPLLLGIRQAEFFGFEIKKIFFYHLILSLFLIALAVSTVGSIGFVGLLIPHLVRQIYQKPKHRIWILFCFFLGGSLTVLADLMARFLFFPKEIPAGVFTSLIGVPFFIYYMMKNK